MEKKTGTCQVFKESKFYTIAIEKLLALSLIILLMGCRTNQFTDFYSSENLDVADYIPRDREYVKIIDTFDLTNTLKKYLEDGYIVIGTSKFTNEWISRILAIDTAEKKGATLVIIGSKIVRSVEKRYAIPIAKANTVHHSGNISVDSYRRGNVGGYGGANYNSRAMSNINYSGTSTHYTTEIIGGSYYILEFEQTAYFLAKKREIIK